MRFVAENATAQRQDNWFARQERRLRAAWDDPTLIATWLRNWTVEVWCSKGAGFYGLGYAVTFVTSEIVSVLAILNPDNSVPGYVAQAVFETVTKLTIQSFINAFTAIFWPLVVLNWLGGFGIIVLIGSYIVFQKRLRPAIEARVPELAASRAAREAKKAAKKRPAATPSAPAGE